MISRQLSESNVAEAAYGKGKRRIGWMPLVLQQRSGRFNCANHKLRTEHPISSSVPPKSLRLGLCGKLVHILPSAAVLTEGIGVVSFDPRQRQPSLIRTMAFSLTAVGNLTVSRADGANQSLLWWFSSKFNAAKLACDESSVPARPSLLCLPLMPQPLILSR